MKTKANAMKDLAKTKKYKITLQKQGGLPDGAGGFKTGWITVATVWANFRKPRMSIASETGTNISDVTQEIEIWFRSDVCKGWRILYGKRIFTIEHPPYSYDSENIILICQEVVK